MRATYDFWVGSARFPFEEATRQGIENAVDAQAQRTDLYIQPGQYFRCIDDGIGVTRAKLQGLNQVGVRNNRPEENLIGKNDSGRLLHLRLAGEMRYRWVSADYPVVTIHHFTRGDLSDLLSRMKADGESPSLEREPEVDACVPEWCRQRLGEGRTGTALELVAIDGWHLFTSITEFRRKLRDLLSVWIAERVYVNDELIPQRLVEDKYTGTMQIDPGKYPKLGKECEFYFYRTRKPTRQDHIFFGKNPIQSIDEFLDPIREPMLVAQVPDWMRLTAVSGFLHLPVVNNFAHFDRRQLNPAIYDDRELTEQIVYFLSDEIAPKLEERYPHLKQDREQVAAARDDLETLAGMFRTGSPVGGTPPPDVVERPGSHQRPRNMPGISIRPSAPEIVIGQEETFEVIKGPKNGRWHGRKSGGTLDAETGPRVLYTAGETPGIYTLEYAPLKGEKVRIRIELVEKKGFQLSKHFFDMYPGRDFELKVLNYDGDEDALTFEVLHQKTKRPTRHIQCLMSGKTAVFAIAVDCPPDYYECVVRAPGDMQDKAVVLVEPYPEEFIHIGDTWYELRKNLESQPAVEITERHGTSPRSGVKVSTMWINPEADPLPEIIAQHGKGVVFFQTLRMACVLAHQLKGQAGDDTLQTTMSLLGEAMREEREKQVKTQTKRKK